MAKNNKSKAVHAVKIKANAPFSKKAIMKEKKGHKFRQGGNFKSLVNFDVSGIKNYEKR